VVDLSEAEKSAVGCSILCNSEMGITLRRPTFVTLNSPRFTARLMVKIETLSSSAASANPTLSFSTLFSWFELICCTLKVNAATINVNRFEMLNRPNRPKVRVTKFED
jgi:hypothetical protein